LKGGNARLVGTVRDDAGAARERLSWSDVSKRVISELGIEVSRVNWFSTYRVHHRMATRFRKGRAFLLGDAGHVHSPVGGQGMNTGIGDAVNLAWKLAAVLLGRAGAAILDSYEPERIGFARRLVDTTDRAFTAVTSDGSLARYIRLHVVPLMMPAMLGFAAARRLLFRTVSQTALNYRGSALSVGHAGRVRGGDRLPWVRLGGPRDNFSALSSLDWQAHVYGAAAPGIDTLCRETRLPLHVFAWSEQMHRAGIVRDAMYLVRPDLEPLERLAEAPHAAHRHSIRRAPGHVGLRYQRRLEAVLGGLAQALLAEGHGADLPRQTQFSEGDQRIGQRAVREARSRGQHDGEVARRLRHAYAADHVGEHILALQRKTRVAVRHGQEHGQAVAVYADRNPSWIRAHARIGQHLHFDEERPGTFAHHRDHASRHGRRVTR
jgi:hypothetical protein